MITRRTVTTILAQLGLSRRRFIDPTGESHRTPGVITALRPGHMVHIDVTKVGKIPDGGWKLHGRGRGSKHCRPGYPYLHSSVDGYSGLAYTEVFDDETAASAAEFLRNARAFFEAHGITGVEGVVTDDWGCYRSEVSGQAVARTSRHQRIAPYTPKHHGKVERYHRIMVEDVLCARPLCPPVMPARSPRKPSGVRLLRCGMFTIIFIVPIWCVSVSRRPRSFVVV